MRIILTIAAAALLAGCGEQPATKELTSSDLPYDPEVKAFIAAQCIQDARGPTVTHDNDLDEMVVECDWRSYDPARYCPPKESRCPYEYKFISRDDVRRILPAKPSRR